MTGAKQPSDVFCSECGAYTRIPRPSTALAAQRHTATPAAESCPPGWCPIPRLAEGLVKARVFLAFDELATEVLFGGEGVVRRAAQREVVCGVLPAFCKWLEVVELEAMRFATTLVCVVDVAAASAVSLEDRPTNVRGDVSPALARVGFLGNLLARA